MLDIISERIKSLRLAHSMNQKDFANRIGISQPTLSCYENGTAFPSIEILINIASIFGVSIDWICGLSQDQLAISKLSDFIRCLFELDKTTNLRYEIEITDRTDIDKSNKTKRQAAIIFTDNDPAHPRNKEICSFLDNFNENRQAFESYITTKDQYEWWQKYTLERYNDITLTQKQYEDLPTERRIALRNALFLKEAQKAKK